MKIENLNGKIRQINNKKAKLSERVDWCMLPIIISMFGFGVAMTLVSPFFLIGVVSGIVLGSIVKTIEKNILRKYDNEIRDLIVEIQAEYETSDMSVENINEKINACKKELEESKQRSATLKNEKREETSKVKKHSLGDEISENNLKIDEQERYITKLIEIRNRKEKSI